MSLIPECELVYAMHLLPNRQNMLLANDSQINLTIGASGVIWLHCGNNNKLSLVGFRHQHCLIRLRKRVSARVKGKEGDS